MTGEPRGIRRLGKGDTHDCGSMTPTAWSKGSFGWFRASLLLGALEPGIPVMPGSRLKRIGCLERSKVRGGPLLILVFRRLPIPSRHPIVGGRTHSSGRSGYTTHGIFRMTRMYFRTRIVCRANIRKSIGVAVIDARSGY